MNITYPFSELKAIKMVDIINSGKFRKCTLHNNKLGFVFMDIDHKNCMMSSYFSNVIVDMDTLCHYTIDLIGLSNIYIYV